MGQGVFILCSNSREVESREEGEHQNCSQRGILHWLVLTNKSTHIQEFLSFILHLLHRFTANGLPEPSATAGQPNATTSALMHFSHCKLNTFNKRHGNFITSSLVVIVSMFTTIISSPQRWRQWEALWAFCCQNYLHLLWISLVSSPAQMPD